MSYQLLPVKLSNNCRKYILSILSKELEFSPKELEYAPKKLEFAPKEIEFAPKELKFAPKRNTICHRFLFAPKIIIALKY